MKNILKFILVTSIISILVVWSLDKFIYQANFRIKIEPYFIEANNASEKIIGKYNSKINEFINSKKLKTDKFADEVLSYTTKYNLAKYFFSDKKFLNDYFEKMFETTVLSASDIDTIMNEIINETASDLGGIENEMVIKIRKNINSNIQASEKINDVINDFKASKTNIISNSAIAASRSVINEILSFVVPEIITFLAVQAGILSTSAATTFGIGIVIGIAVDFAIEKISGIRETVKKMVSSSLDRLNPLMTDKINEIISERKNLWNQYKEAIISSQSIIF